MFNYWKKVDALNHINRLLLFMIVILILIITGLTIALIKAPKNVEFWLAPSMSTNGGLIKSSDIPNEYVHGFVTTLIPSLNSWSKRGKKEMNENLNGFHYYFTKRFEDLMYEKLKAYDNAQLFNRTQVASLYRFMEPDDIKRLGPDVWEVHLVLQITQRLNEKSSMVIADKVVDYHFRVVKVNLSKLLNPFQLAIDGYTKPERLVKDLLSGKEREESDEE